MMPFGKGVYDDLATQARRKAKAQGVILIVIGGEHGDGFSMQSTHDAIEIVLRGLVETTRGVLEQFALDAMRMERMTEEEAVESGFLTIEEPYE